MNTANPYTSSPATTYGGPVQSGYYSMGVYHPQPGATPPAQSPPPMGQSQNPWAGSLGGPAQTPAPPSQFGQSGGSYGTGADTQAMNWAQTHFNGEVDPNAGAGQSMLGSNIQSQSLPANYQAPMPGVSASPGAAPNYQTATNTGHFNNGQWLPGSSGGVGVQQGYGNGYSNATPTPPTGLQMQPYGQNGSLTQGQTGWQPPPLPSGMAGGQRQMYPGGNMSGQLPRPSMPPPMQMQHGGYGGGYGGMMRQPMQHYGLQGR